MPVAGPLPAVAIRIVGGPDLVREGNPDYSIVLDVGQDEIGAAVR